MKRLILLIVLIFLTACATSPPRQTSDLCSIFSERKSWYRHAKRASDRWGIPIATLMAFMYQESRFVHNARPPRKKILGFIPGARPSSAYGYAQAKRSTWHWYQRETGHDGADRNDFDDAVDFVAWYNHITVKKNKVRASDTYSLYLAYHEGHGGFSRGSFRKKAWLKKTAQNVATRASRYQSQLAGCESKFKRKSWWPFG